MHWYRRVTWKPYVVPAGMEYYWTGMFTQFPFRKIILQQNGKFIAAQTDAAQDDADADAFCQLLNEFGGDLWFEAKICDTTKSLFIASQEDKRHYHYRVRSWKNEDEKRKFNQLCTQLKYARTTRTSFSCNEIKTRPGLQKWLKKYTGRFLTFYYAIYFIRQP